MNKAVIVCSKNIGALYVSGALEKTIDESVIEDRFWLLRLAAEYNFYPEDCTITDLNSEDLEWVIKIGTFPPFIYDFSWNYDFMPNKVDEEIV